MARDDRTARAFAEADAAGEEAKRIIATGRGGGITEVHLLDLED